MKKVLVVCYSQTGTSRAVARLLAAEGPWEMAEVRDAQSRRGTLRCVLDSMLRRRPPIAYDGPDPVPYDVVALVSPIWMLRLAGPMRSFVEANAARMDRVAVVSVMNDRGAPRAVAEVARLLGRAPAIDACFRERDVQDGSFAARVRSLAAAVGDTADAPSRPARQVVLSPEAA